MTAAIGQAEIDGTRFLKLSGELRHDNAAPLEALIDHWFAAEPAPFKSMVIDLTTLTFMDSTVIGLLAGIARELQERALPPATLFSTSRDINQLLHSLCLDEAFTLIDAAGEAGTPLPLSELPQASDQGQVSPASILKAHEQLMALNEANRSAFQPVVDLLRAEH